MALPVTDTWTSGTSQGIEAYGPYSVLEGGFNVVNGSPGLEVTSGSYNTARRTDETPDADQYAQTVITAAQISNGIYCGPAVRCQSGANTSYHCETAGSDFYVSKCLAGTQTVIAGPISVSFAAGDVLRLEVSGVGATVTLKVFKAAAASPTSFGQVGTDYTDSSSPITTAGYVGVFGYGNTGGGARVIGTWSAGNLSVSTDPALTDVDTDEIVQEGQLAATLSGANLGANTSARVLTIEQGSVSVTQSQIVGDATSGQFDFTLGGLKFGSATAKVTRNSDSLTATLAITVNPATGQIYQDIGTPDTTASNRISASGDLASGDQIHVRGTDGGAAPAGLTLGTDGTFYFLAGYRETSFAVRVWDSSDQTWGAWAVQTIMDISTARMKPSQALADGVEPSFKDELTILRWFE